MTSTNTESERPIRGRELDSKSSTCWKQTLATSLCWRIPSRKGRWTRSDQARQINKMSLRVLSKACSIQRKIKLIKQKKQLWTTGPTQDRFHSKQIIGLPLASKERQGLPTLQLEANVGKWQSTWVLIPELKLLACPETKQWTSEQFKLQEWSTLASWMAALQSQEPTATAIFLGHSTAHLKSVRLRTKQATVEPSPPEEPSAVAPTKRVAKATLHLTESP